MVFSQSPQLQNAPVDKIKRAKAVNYLALVAHQEPTAAKTGGTPLVKDRLLQQIRSVITGGKEPNANGGIAGWTHNSIAQAFVLAKNTPVVWNALTSTEKSKIDWLMRAMAVVGHLQYDDQNDYRKDMAYWQWNKAHAVNFTEGYLGVIIAASIYFGPTTLDGYFTSFSWDTYIAQFQAFGFTNILECWQNPEQNATFNWKPVMENGDPDGAGGDGAGVKNTFSYTYNGVGPVGLNNPLGIFHAHAIGKSFSRPVINGITEGGIEKSWTWNGALHNGDSPFEGQMGMCREFNSSDEGGTRSSAVYVVDGWQNSVSTRATLTALGYWDGSLADAVHTRMFIGSEDLHFKLTQGFRGWHHGGPQGDSNFTVADAEVRSYGYVRDMWVVMRDGLLGGGGGPATPSGLTATPAAYNQINLSWTDNASNETGFKIERKKGAGGTYAQIGTAAVNATSYNDNTCGTGTNYYYRVRAYNGSGDSAYSNEANATTTEVADRKGHWKLDEGSGTTTADASGSGNTGTLGTSPANPAWGTGKLGSALNFDGADDVVNAGSGTSLDNLTAVTVAAWIKADTLGEGGKGRIVVKGASVGPTAGWHLHVNTSNSLEFRVDYSTTDLSRVSADSVFGIGAWKHVVVTWTGSATATNIRFYVDGVETGYGTTTNGVGTRAIDGTSNLYIGNESGGTRTFDGHLDDVRVYSRALTAAEVTALYRAGL